MTVAAALLTVVLPAHPVFALDPDTVFTKWGEEISAESAAEHFGARLGEQAIQSWNVTARFSLLPFGTLRFHHLGGVLDGAPEVGIGPTFARFESINRTFAGAGLWVRYYLVHFDIGPLVPWIGASITPGWSDIKIGRVSNETRLTGPFMDTIQAGAGLSWFVNRRFAIYAGYQAQHYSNAGWNGANKNFSLNTAEGAVLGMSWFLR